MAFFTVGPTPTSDYLTISAALVDAAVGDTITLESGYSDETVAIALNNITVSGEASSTGIVLQLGAGVTTFTLTGEAPFEIQDGTGGNGIVGNAGDNLITVSSGIDAVDGGAGTDRLVVDYHLATGNITGDSTSNFTEAGVGGRSITVTAGTIEHFTILTGSGADTITTGNGDDQISVSDGANTITAGDGNNAIDGGNDADTVTVGDGKNFINARNGANTIDAGQGSNTIFGGNGTDTITAGDGGNTILGGDGTNILTSGAGDDSIFSGNGAATIVAGAGADQITVQGGASDAQGGEGDDRLTIDYSGLTSDITGGITDGSLFAGYNGHVGDAAENMADFTGIERLTLLGGSGNDILISGDGDDVMAGNGGSDTLTSFDGDDQFTGGAGDDVLNGSAGNDTAYFSGARNDYSVTVDGEGTPILVVDTRAGSPDGTDTLINIENLRFALLSSVPTGTVTIDGTATEDQVLTASNTLVDADGVGPISYQWLSNGTNIAGATGDTLTLTQVQVGTLITVAASYTDGGGHFESIESDPTTAVVNVNDDPTGAVTIDGTPTQGEILTASQNLADEDGLDTVSYQWQADGTDIAGATDATFTLGQAQVDSTITVVASYTDGQGTEEFATSDATVAVANVNDAPTGAVTIDGTPTEDQELTVSDNLVDADGLGTISYQWRAGGVDIEGATGTSFTLTQAQVGTYIDVRASYTDDQGTAEQIYSSTAGPVVNVNDDPTGSVTIIGTPTENEDLTANNTLGDEDGLGTFSYQWQSDGNAIDGATNGTFTLTQAEVGHAITVLVSYTDLQGTDESAISEPTDFVANANDAPTGEVTIAGTPTEDEILTASNSLEDGNGLGDISYQWQSNGEDIVGATGDTLILAQAQVGTSITVLANYTDNEGHVESVGSEPTTAVANVNDLPTGEVTIAGTPTTGETLTAVQTLVDEDGLGEINYQWQANGVDIDGATGATFTLTESQVGATIDVRASYLDQQGTAEVVGSNPTGAVVPAFQYTDTGSGDAGQTGAMVYQGPVTYLQYEYAGTPGGEAVGGTSFNDFMHLGAGDDAANGGAGDDVIDGGTGSNFLTGGAGRDVFFLDARGGETTWSTIADWQGGEEVALFGWVQGVSKASFVENDGIDGYRGVTMHADCDGNGVIDTSVTWAGKTQADIPTPTVHDNLLWFA